jgi:hypothetical protein
MEPNLPPSDTTVIKTPHDYNKLLKKIAVIIFIIIAATGVLLLGYYLWQQNQSFSNNQITNTFKTLGGIPAPTESSLPKLPYEVENGLPLSPNTEIAKIGEETIYQKDLERAITLYPPNTANKINKTTVILDKIARDSIILQAGQKMGLAQLDNGIFNSPYKDYAKRTKAVNDVISKVSSQADTITGSVASIWFKNVVPAEVGLEKGKQIAFDKISGLQAQVKAGTITMAQAIAGIKNDTSLAQLDKVYKNNAGQEFKANPTDKITFIPEFDKLIRDLPAGGVTDVYLGSDKDDNNTPYEALYMFAKVDNKTQNGQIVSFDDWYNKQKKQYEITYF